MISFFFLALSTIIIFLMMAIRKTSGRGRRAPPGPRGLPLIGNFLQFDRRDLHLRLTRLSKKYGPLMSMNIAHQPVLVISSAKVAKEALKDNDLAFSGRPQSICSKKLSYGNREIISSTYTPYWREMRKLVVLNLFTQKQVHSFRPTREEEVSTMIQEISNKADLGEVIDLNETLMSFAIGLLCRFAFGIKYDDKNNNKRFHELFFEFQSMMVTVLFADFFPSLGWIDKLNGNVARLDRVFKDMDSIYQEVIDKHLDPNRPQSLNDDILDLLIQLRNEHVSSTLFDWDNVKGLLMNVLTAGTETSASTVTWIMTALIKNPKVLKKAQEEIRNLIGTNYKGKLIDEDDIQKLSYLKAIIKETLRLYPPVPLSIEREITEKCTVNGYEIQPKSIVFLNVWAIGRDPEYWENPDEFLPERFMNNSTVDVKGHDFGLIPFGAGRRICPGMGLGIATVELALANLLYAFDWELPDGMQEKDIDMQALPGVTIHKKTPLCLKAKIKIDE